MMIMFLERRLQQNNSFASYLCIVSILILVLKGYIGINAKSIYAGYLRAPIRNQKRSSWLSRDESWQMLFQFSQNIDSTIEPSSNFDPTIEPSLSHINTEQPIVIEASVLSLVDELPLSSLYPTEQQPSNVQILGPPSPVINERMMPLQGKKGVCITLRDAEHPKGGSHVENIPNIFELNPHWVYTWGNRPSDGVVVVQTEEGPLQITPGEDNSVNDVNSVELKDFIPMLWGYYPKNFDTFLLEIKRQRPHVVLAFNEPDMKEQSNVAVDVAVKVWPELVETVEQIEREVGRDVLLVSPACANSFGWIDTFMTQASEQSLRVDAIGVHWYDRPNFEAFQRKMERIYLEYDLPLMLTEFAVANWSNPNAYSEEEVLEFMAKVLPWLEEEVWILGYSWFSFDIEDVNGSSALFDNDDELTKLGHYYSDFNPANSY